MNKRTTTYYSLKRKTHFLLTLFFLMMPLISVPAMAVNPNNEKISIEGLVVDEKGEPIIGANVTERGTTNGTVTDFDGNFKLQADPKSELLISYVGYLTQTLPVKSHMKIVLKEDAQGLEEVVVVGYGVQKKVNLSGAVESLKGENLSKRNTMQASQALQGMAPGVTVTSNNGRPGKEGTTIRVRGIGTINDNNPLVLIDGVSSSMDAIDPNDIESISILKDAASSAIYGSRAANGVILVTTRRGKQERTVVNYKGSLSFTSPIKLPQLSNAWDYMTLYDEAYANDQRKADGTPGGYIYGPELIETWKNATDRDAYPNSNIIRETFKKHALQTNHYVGVSTGTEKLRSNTSVNYSWQDALTRNSDYKRYGIRSNNDYIISDVFSVGADISVRKTNSKDASVGMYGTGIQNLLRNPAIYATKYSNGTWGGGYNGDGTAMFLIDENLEMQKESWQEVLTKLRLTITPVKDLRLDFWYAPKFSDYDKTFIERTQPIYDYLTGEVSYKPVNKPFINENYAKTREDDVNVNINYNTSFGKHDFGALAGYQYLRNNYRTRNMYREGNEFQQFEEINAFDPVGMKNGGSRTEWALMSYFGRVNYAYANKYLVEANIRYDGSSHFASGHKWGTFPSFSGAWRFQSESFMSSFEWLSNGKLRGSWGKLGNQSGLGSEYPFALLVNTSQYQVFGGEMAPGYAPVNFAMQDITWESTEMANVGIDLGFFNGKLDVTFDWYKKITNDILLSLPIPSVMGYGNNPKQNAGKIQNKGWDLSITHTNTVNDFYYRITGILSDVKNKIIDLGELPIYNGIYIQRNGQPYNSIYGYVAEGLFNSFDEAKSHSIKQWGSLQGGDIKYKDVNGDGKINGDDRVILGNALPRWNYSLDLFGSYKGFDLSVFFQGVGKRDGFVNGWVAYPLYGNASSLVEHMDRWYEGNPNPNAAYPRLSINNQTNNTQTSSFWLTDASYLRLKNIQLGWNMPKKWFRNSSVSNIRLFANGNNVFTITNLSQGMDPESPDQDVQNAYPLLRSYSFGVEVSF